MLQLIELSINNTQHIIMTDPVGQTEDMTHKLYRVEEPESWTYKDYVPLGLYTFIYNSNQTVKY